MSDRYEAAKALAKKSEVPERLQLFGDWPHMKAKDALDDDWLHVLLICVTDAVEAMRLRSGDESVEATQKLRRNLAIIAATCDEWELRL